MKLIIGIAVILLPLLSGAQRPLKPAGIGDSVPGTSLGTIINYAKPVAAFSDFKGRLLILDFWATWCSSCIGNFPKMESLQKEFGSAIQVLAVAYEEKKKIVAFFSSKAGREYHFASVVNDTILSSLFPHTGIPHCVWINGDGKVIAITGAEEVTATNIRNALSQKTLSVEEKKDLDPARPLLLSDLLGANRALLHYSIFSKGRYSGLPTGNQLHKSGNIIIGQSSTNSHLLLLYTSAAIHLFNDLGEQYCDKRSIIEVAGMSGISADTSLPDSVNKSNQYNYDIIVPESDAAHLYGYMLEDLNRYTAYTGKIEKRLTKCLVLVRTDSIDRIKTRGGSPSNTLFGEPPYTMHNYPMQNLVSRLNSEDSIRLPVVDETHYTGNIDIQLSPSDDINILKKELQRYGLDLIEAVRLLNMFVLSDKQP
jgi:thiol-disulfide isomerase/thioredoxin